VTALSRFWMPVTPAARLGMVRVIVGLYGAVYLTVRLPHLLSYALDDVERFQPVGVVSLAPAPTLPVIYQALVVVTVVLAWAFLLGVKHRVLAPIYAGLLLWVLTYSNSWGKILHTDNVLVMHVVALAFSRSADALSFDARERELPAASPRYGWPLKLMATVCVLVYLLAGIAKLRNSGMEFVDGETLRNYIAWGNVRKIALGSTHSPLGAALVGAPGLFAGLAWLSLVLELGAPAALFSRRVAKWWVLGIWGFHVGVLALMAIGFLYQMTFVAFAPFFRCERLLRFGTIRRALGKLGAEKVWQREAAEREDLEAEDAEREDVEASAS